MRRLLVAAVALSALTACGTSAAETDTAKVATLQSPSAAAGKATPKPAAQRPRERLDTTPEEFEALLGPYNKCLAEHGGIAKGSTIQQQRKQAQAGPAGPASGAQTAKFDAANKICEPQYYPLPPWEKDPANPEAKDFARATVKCLKQKGVEYVEVSEDGLSIALGGDQNDPKSISMGLDLIPGCERDIAKQNK
ncbi:hypothetical protein AB0J83_24930 [Actinoplanes sp. NPDC049596]|uniref:hypothetical protein n=1 Tax=unclassified Actinoplanes TaxID=2626549 RepID=UPI0034445DA1